MWHFRISWSGRVSCVRPIRQHRHQEGVQGGLAEHRGRSDREYTLGSAAPWTVGLSTCCMSAEWNLPATILPETSCKFQLSEGLKTAGQGFLLATKYYLPRLLLAPVGHVFLYHKYVLALLHAAPTVDDRESFKQVPSLGNLVGWYRRGEVRGKKLSKNYWRSITRNQN